MMFVGRLGEDALAAAGISPTGANKVCNLLPHAAMASTLANVTGLSVLIGLSSALTTLGVRTADPAQWLIATVQSQAFGAKTFDLVGLVLQRCLVTYIGTCTVVSLLWLFGIEPFLIGILLDASPCCTIAVHSIVQRLDNHRAWHN